MSDALPDNVKNVVLLPLIKTESLRLESQRREPFVEIHIRTSPTALIEIGEILTDVARGSTGNLAGIRSAISCSSAKTGSAVGESDGEMYEYDPDGCGDGGVVGEDDSIGAGETDASGVILAVGEAEAAGSGDGLRTSASDGST